MASPDVVITRIFDAEPELLFRAWVEREHLVRWFAPRGCALEVYTLEVREGGAFHFCVRDLQRSGGGDCWSQGVFLEVRPPERLVYQMTFADELGRPITPEAAGRDPEWPEVTTVTVLFVGVDNGSRTRVTLHQTVPEALAKRMGAYSGWLDMLGRLADELKGEPGG